MTVDQLLVKAGVPPRHLGSSLELWQPRAGTEAGHRAVTAWTAAPIRDPRGVFLYGPPGTGKTHLVVAALRARLSRILAAEVPPESEWQRQADLHACYVTTPVLLDDLRAAVTSRDPDVERRFRHYRSACPLLVLDDLGREKVTDWADERLYVLVEGRYGGMLPTLVTSNLTPKQLVDAGYGAIVSRLTEMSAVAEVRASDFRPAKGAAR